jgi:hypothetical protein
MLSAIEVRFGERQPSFAKTATIGRLGAVFPRFLTHFIELFPTLATMRLVGPARAVRRVYGS